jgi:hypothetical protein
VNDTSRSRANDWFGGWTFWDVFETVVDGLYFSLIVLICCS